MRHKSTQLQLDSFNYTASLFLISTPVSCLCSMSLHTANFAYIFHFVFRERTGVSVSCDGLSVLITFSSVFPPHSQVYYPIFSIQADIVRLRTAAFSICLPARQCSTLTMGPFRMLE